MALPRALPVVLGSIAALATVALFVMHIVLTRSLSDPSSPVRIAAIASSIVESLVLVTLFWVITLHLGRWSYHPFSNHSGVWFGLLALLYTISAAISTASLVFLSNPAYASPSTTLGSKAISFLIGTSVALGLSFAAQLIFLVIHFVLFRMHGLRPGHSLRTGGSGHRSPQTQVKSIPYSQTSPASSDTLRGRSWDYRSPPGSSGGRSAAETMSSIRSSLSHVVRPISSMTRLVTTGSQRSPRRPGSFESSTYNRERFSAGDDAFDSWDTSSVDPQNRQTILQTSGSATGRFLETIPASPTTSRSPSPGTPLDLEPPRPRRRSRSYSPVSTRARSASQAAGLTQHASVSEAHIHPLFRSDSPTPPPVARPGTIVTAAPNAGQLISDAHSIRSLSRKRSGSLPHFPSPLSRQGSIEDFGRRVIDRDGLRLSEGLQEEDEDEEEGTPGTSVGDQQERKMTPPIPDWIMSAGSRKSLYDYNNRKQRSGGEKEKGPAEGS